MSLTYQLTFNRDAVKFVAKQERAVQERIRKSLLGLTVRPPVGDIRPMKGYDKRFRLRVGSYRILFEINHQEQVIYILTIDNRGDIY
ncbi:type II toxin-antitoxin system RelE/ParE family toxin [Paenibacillus sp. F411]|uniref:type II toxin-antitoxin system RelE family toxin n=1 Tax=unclassified Paenibacillus TaxID=185978 RepID=UPI001AAF6E95|nr:type II toxin-antitoxin system RelE/ParE family toxin [Paenibacillus sp. F411]MBO2945212.1 type II toxin-antitoxin system RelE/ParE family toxin [Paenibacillus sp. F411]